MSVGDKIDISVDAKQTIHFRVARAMVICSIAIICLLVLVAVMALGTSSSYLTKDIADNYVAHIGPAMRAALDSKSSQEELRQKLSALEHLDLLAHGVLLDEQNKPLAEWHRDGDEAAFDGKIAKKIAAGEFKSSGTILYIKSYIDNKKDYSVMVGLDAVGLFTEQITRFGLFYFVGAIGFVLFCYLAFYLADFHLIKPLTHVGEHASKMLDKSDLTYVLPFESDTEIGQCTIVINTINDKMRTLLLSFRDVCEEFEKVVKSLEEQGGNVSADSQTMKKNIDNTKGKMEELTTSFMAVNEELSKLTAQSERGSTTVYEMGQVNQEMFENVTAMSSSVMQSIEAIKQMGAAIEQTGSYVGQLNDDIGSVNASMQRLDSSIALEEKSAFDSINLSKELAQNADNGMTALKQTIEGIEQIQNNSGEIAKVIATLGDHAMDIGNILHVIDDVTKQTNLLALNAAIISAQAGEHGRGFAVVADEIGALASRTKDSTKEIAELIDTIQNEAKMAVAVMEESNSTIERGAKLGAEAARAFDKLKESADKSTAQAKILAEATAEQSTDVKNVTQAIASITGTVEAINHSARRQADEAAALNQAANKMNMLNQQVARSSEEQARSAKEVLRVIQNISKMAEAVNGRQIAQTEGTKLAVSTISAVGNCANLQDESTGRLTRAIDEISHHIGKLQSYTKEFKIS